MSINNLHVLVQYTSLIPCVENDIYSSEKKLNANGKTVLIYIQRLNPCKTLPGSQNLHGLLLSTVMRKTTRH